MMNLWHLKVKIFIRKVSCLQISLKNIITACDDDIDTQDMHLNVKLLKYDTFYKVITRILLSLPKYAKKHHIFLTDTHIGTNCFSLFFFSTTQITVTYNFASKCQRILSIHIKVIYGKFIHLLLYEMIIK